MKYLFTTDTFWLTASKQNINRKLGVLFFKNCKTKLNLYTPGMRRAIYLGGEALGSKADNA